jgi:hypothetical protein
MIQMKQIGALAVFTALAAGCAHEPPATSAAAEEASACNMVPEAIRVDGPLAPSRVESVAVVRDHNVFPKGAMVPVGVSVQVRAEPGLTQEWLGRMVACHVAHVVASGQDASQSPLAVSGADISVKSNGTSFSVVVTSKNSDVAHAIVDRGEGLAKVMIGKSSI